MTHALLGRKIGGRISQARALRDLGTKSARDMFALTASLDAPSPLDSRLIRYYPPHSFIGAFDSLLAPEPGQPVVMLGWSHICTTRGCDAMLHVLERAGSPGRIFLRTSTVVFFEPLSIWCDLIVRRLDVISAIVLEYSLPR